MKDMAVDDDKIGWWMTSKAGRGHDESKQHMTTKWAVDNTKGGGRQ
jgi:hypothetical protein